ncbi:hypothetical protein HMPREF1486_02055 [Streptomyces sp. HPH0547]|uniref:hypothetical protein n=1 Tax=Streptomyces TaxID=1883 RepID=UPI00034EA301|nr:MULTISPECIES: hypothetical protein [unclassified Streptomyces]EPD95272.1 hypothetical protein HMPREF1486_02055 [Streptomyces sp. HPH0547]
MDVGVVIVLVLLLAFFVLGGIATVRTVRAVKRGVERTGAQVRRTVEETTLKARSAQPGPVGEAARIRLELRSSIDGTRAALEAGASADPGLSEAVSLLDQLHEHARRLDGELRLLMEREPDRARLAARLPEARERMRHIKESADALRFAAQDRARQFDDEELAELRGRIDIETGALRHWVSEPAPGQAPGAGTPGDGATGRSSASSSSSSPSSSSSSSPSSASFSRQRPAQPELGPSGQQLDPSLTDPTADRRRSAQPFGKRPPRSAS